MGLAATAPSLFDQLSAVSEARSTLDELIVATWRELRFRGTAACPVCGGPMTRRTGGGAGGHRPDVVAGCQDCGAELE